MADVLFGDYNPAGRLPVTFLKSLDDSCRRSTTTACRAAPTGSWRRSRSTAFGYGLSYTTFKYSNLQVSGWKVKVDVKNTGPCDGDEVVQAYVSHLTPGVPVPLRQLAGFRRVHLRKGQKKTVTIHLERGQFAAYDDAGKRLEPNGKFRVHVGGGQTGGLVRDCEITAAEGKPR